MGNGYLLSVIGGKKVSSKDYAVSTVQMVKVVEIVESVKIVEGLELPEVGASEVKEELGSKQP